MTQRWENLSIIMSLMFSQQMWWQPLWWSWLNRTTHLIWRLEKEMEKFSLIEDKRMMRMKATSTVTSWITIQFVNLQWTSSLKMTVQWMVSSLSWKKLPRLTTLGCISARTRISPSNINSMKRTPSWKILIKWPPDAVMSTKCGNFKKKLRLKRNWKYVSDAPSIPTLVRLRKTEKRLLWTYTLLTNTTPIVSTGPWPLKTQWPPVSIRNLVTTPLRSQGGSCSLSLPMSISSNSPSFKESLLRRIINIAW